VNKLENAGSKLKLIPGVMPVTNVKQLVKFAQLSGTQIPEKTRARFEAVTEDENAVRALGVEVASELCAQLLALGCNSLHFYTMNTAEATVKVCQNLDLGN
jgi:methylenetetrahydrofolate reductase (NADPH)